MILGEAGPDLGGDVISDKGVGVEILICCIVLGLLCLGATPKQSEVPPQAFFADYFSGKVVLRGAPPPSITGGEPCGSLPAGG